MQLNGFGIHENEAQEVQSVSIKSENEMNFPPVHASCNSIHMYCMRAVHTYILSGIESIKSHWQLNWYILSSPFEHLNISYMHNHRNGSILRNISNVVQDCMCCATATALLYSHYHYHWDWSKIVRWRNSVWIPGDKKEIAKKWQVLRWIWYAICTFIGAVGNLSELQWANNRSAFTANIRRSLTLHKGTWIYNERTFQKVKITWVDFIQCTLYTVNCTGRTLAHVWIGNFVRSIHSTWSHLSKYFVSPLLHLLCPFYHIFMVFHFVSSPQISDQCDPFFKSKWRNRRNGTLLFLFQWICWRNKQCCDCIPIRT